jgi:hypothetical protein
MTQRLPDPMIGVRAEQIPTIWEGSVAMYLRFPGEAPGPAGAKVWHKVTHVSNTANEVTVHFGDDTQDKTLAANEQVDVAAAKDICDVPGEGWLNA